jgi:hypothetical protein
MTRPIPKCRFCGKDLRRSKRRIIIEEGQRGERVRWACCGSAKCLDEFASCGRIPGMPGFGILVLGATKDAAAARRRR